MPPNGGFGGNTGIADAYDLAWKLAFVVKGVADPELLSTYDAERRSVGELTVEQAYSRYVTRTATYLGATDYQPIIPDLEIELGYIYRSGSIVDGGTDDGKGHDDPRQTRGRPGTRAPHLWVEHDRRRMSTLDLFGRSFVLLAAPQGADLSTQLATRPRTTMASNSRRTASMGPTCAYWAGRSPMPTVSPIQVPCWCDPMGSSPGGRLR